MPTVFIYWSHGRTDDQKKQVAKRITQTLVEQGGARAEDVLIVFQHIEQGNAIRGHEFIHEDSEVEVGNNHADQHRDA